MNKTCPPCHGDCNQGRTCPKPTRGLESFQTLGWVLLCILAAGFGVLIELLP
jgi:hypothetical protein